MANTAAPVKKGNKTTEIILGTGAQKLEAGIKTLLSVAPEIGKLAELAQKGTLEVSDLEDKIGGLKQDFANKVAQNKIEIEQQFNSDQKAFVMAWCQENGMTCIVITDHENLTEELANLKQNFSVEVAKAVNAATASMKKDHENEMKMKTLEHEKKEADNTATIKQNTTQIKFLEEQVGYWKKALEDERVAGVDRAKAASIGTLNVGTPR